MKHSLMLALAAAVVPCFATVMSADEAAAKLPDKQNFHLFVLAGQSNMAGRGKIDEQGKTLHARVLALDAGGAWKPAVDPLHFDKPKAAGGGIGKPFGEIIADKNPSVTVGLIPTACGGSPIATWSPGKYFDQTQSHPYDDAIARAKRALQDGTLKAILWHQGESDCNDRSAPTYEDKLREVIITMRKDLGAPDVPFIIGQLGRFPKKPWTPAVEKIDEAHRNVAKTMPHVYFVSADELTSLDGLHFDTPSLHIFATRYADAYQSASASVGGR